MYRENETPCAIPPLIYTYQFSAVLYSNPPNSYSYELLVLIHSYICLIWRSHKKSSATSHSGTLDFGESVRIVSYPVSQFKRSLTQVYS